MEQEDQDETKDTQTPPWEPLLEDLNLYARVQPLPEKLEKFFIGGDSYSSLESVRKSLWKEVKEFATAYVKSRMQKK